MYETQQSPDYSQFSREDLIARLEKLEGELAALRRENQELSEANRALDDRNQQLEKLATHDATTGLRNWHGFQEEAQRVFAEAKRYQQKLTMVVIDLDLFKDVNDNLGHQAGNEALKDVTLYLQMRVRQTDVIARTGGDEFAILMPMTSQKGAELVMKRLQRDYPGFHGIPMNFSYGVAELTEDMTTWQELHEVADQAMYQQKQERKNGR